MGKAERLHGRRLHVRLALGGLLLAILLSACGAASGAGGDQGLRVFTVSSTATPRPTSAPEQAGAPEAQPTPTAVPRPSPTLGPVVYSLDFSSYRHDVLTLHVGWAVEFTLTQGPSSDWLSGVDDARVLRPMAPDGSGVYQAVAPGTALVTAHVPLGCANRLPAVPCRTPEHGLWYQQRVYVLP